MLREPDFCFVAYWLDSCGEGQGYEDEKSRKTSREQNKKDDEERPRYVWTTNKARNNEEVDTDARAAVCSAIEKHLHNEHFDER